MPFQIHQRRYHHGRNDLEEINDFKVGHRSLEEIDPDLSLSAKLL